MPVEASQVHVISGKECTELTLNALVFSFHFYGIMGDWLKGLMVVGITCREGENCLSKLLSMTVWKKQEIKNGLSCVSSLNKGTEIKLICLFFFLIMLSARLK